MVHLVALVLLFIAIFLSTIYSSRKRETFADVSTPKEQTPGERGLVFGYLPKDMNTANINTSSKTNILASGDSIQIYNKDKYLGYGSKNMLFPNFLSRLGTFTPYSYENIKIHVKDNSEKVLYNTTPVYFTIKHLNDSYYLNFVPSTNTFYLSTNTPSYFTFVNVTSPNSKSEVRYDDNVLIKLVDNSEFLFVYEELLITEKGKSSTFVIKKAENVDICANITSKTETNFMPKEMTKEQVAQLEREYKKDIDDYIANVKGIKSPEINTIKERIKLLEGQLEIAKGNSKMKLEMEKLKHQDNMKVKEAEIQTEISKFKADKDIEFTKARDKIVNEKKDQWQKEINELRKLMNKKCSRVANSKTMNTPNKVVNKVKTEATKKPLNTNKV
jgi:hypothetical protein